VNDSDFVSSIAGAERLEQSYLSYAHGERSERRPRAVDAFQR